MIPLHQKYRALINAADKAGAPTELLNACFTLLSLTRAIDADCANRLSQYSLSEGKFVILFLLAQHPKGLAPTEISRSAGVTKATVTGLTDGLVRHKLVERVYLSSDRRSFSIRLTEKGKRLNKKVVKEHSLWISSLFKNLSSADLKNLDHLLHGVWKQTDEGRSTRKAKQNGRGKCQDYKHDQSRRLVNTSQY